MSEIDDLPPDQRAALQLLLKQGRSYDELADLLRINAAAVRQRAHSALDALAPQTDRRLTAGRRADIADYLLGQQAPGDREETRELLAGSAAARAWARSVAGVLRPLAGDGLPEIPDEAPVEAPSAPAQPDGAAAADDRDAGAEPAPYAAGAAARRPASRLGGALLLGGLGIVVAALVIFLLTRGNDDKAKTSRVPARTQTTQAAGNPQPIAQINLFSTTGDRNAVGLAQIFAMGGRRAIIVAGQGVPPGAYALWLYNSPTSARLLGFVPQRVGANGRFATQGELPGDAGNFAQLVVTRENVTRSTRTPPARPGAIVLRGQLKTG